MPHVPSQTALSPGRFGYGLAWLVLLVGGLLSSLAAGWFFRKAEELDRQRFLAGVTNLVERLDIGTERYAEQLERLSDLVEARQVVSEVEWTELMKRLEPASNLPAFLELAYVTNTSLQSRDMMECLQREQPSLPDIPAPSLNIARRWVNGSAATAEQTLTWLQAPLTKSRWWGTAKGRMRSSPRRLLPETTGGEAATVSLFAPVFVSDFTALNEFRPEDSKQLRQHRFMGVVIGTIGWRMFLETSLPTANEDVAFDAFVASSRTARIGPDTWMGSGDKCRVLSQGFQPRFQHTRTWQFFRNQWQLVFYSTPQFDQHSTRYRAWAALGVGLTVSCLMAGTLAVQIRARLRLELLSTELRSTLDELQSARIERERLSHNLHDATIQSLYALQLGLSRTAEEATESSPSLGTRLAEYQRSLTGIIGELRGFILRHEANREPSGDLVGALTSLVERLRHSTGTALVADVSAEAAARLNGEQSVHLANLAREALSNALRHSLAQRISVSLEQTPEGVVLAVVDDGLGFDTAAPPSSGLGLQSMTKRASEAGGRLVMESQAGTGTRVSVVIHTGQDTEPNLET